MLKRLIKFILCSRKQAIRLLNVGLLLCGLLNGAYAFDLSTISQVYFFGDSLTDSGFNDLWTTQGPGVPLPLGKAPTFTTYGGHTWAQYIARDLKGFQLPVYPGPTVPDTITNNSIYPVLHFVSATLNGINYAAAGATTGAGGFAEIWAPSLHLQVAKFLSSLVPGQMLDPNAVYFVWAGANDFLTVLFKPTFPTEEQLLATARTAAVNIANEVALLSAKGAKRVVVISLPNLGLTPLASRAGIPTLPASLKTVSFAFNSMLNTQLGKVIKQYNTKILYVDVYTLLEKVIDATKVGLPIVVDNQSFKFSNYTDPACATASSAIYCPSTAPSDYLFADILHPTDMAHRVISLEVEVLMRNWT